MADAHAAERYFAATSDRGSIIGNPGNEFLWADGALLRAWPANPSENQYTTVRNSNVPTLLIGGTVDFADAGPERHEGTAAPPAQRPPGHPVRARAHGRLLALTNRAPAPTC